ncbi:hypothetical protein EMPS_00217 [Entomortierella parvispora]|uniref:SRA1/Sec31 domain-containing protein n=1 Tax=Entomortierella parvispora TaxID=205924 RepID=A0A9P3LR09_9FUNG|nr:hypothetical protein EMPS_00217 [Entomortierella parvispora]
MESPRNNPILEQDEDHDQVAPLQSTNASGESEDTSSFSAPLGLMPSFKPRKSNRISVLAYPTDGSQLSATSAGSNANTSTTSLPAPAPLSGGPPSLFGAGAATPPGSSASPPPSAMGGMKLPPPPMKTAGTGPSPLPYTKGDFRTAGIEHHWNDPPTQIFAKKVQAGEGAEHDFGPMKETLAKIIAECAVAVPASQKRMFEDTTKRLQALQEQMDKGTVKESVVVPLGEMIQALSTRSFAQCQAIHAKMMQTEFDSEGKWLLGFKRLTDLYATTTPSS